MAGKLFYREHTKEEEGEKTPRFELVAVADMDLKMRVHSLRKQELDQIASVLGADLVELKVDGKGHKIEA